MFTRQSYALTTIHHSEDAPLSLTTGLITPTKITLALCRRPRCYGFTTVSVSATGTSQLKKETVKNSGKKNNNFFKLNKQNKQQFLALCCCGAHTATPAAGGQLTCVSQSSRAEALSSSLRSLPSLDFLPGLSCSPQFHLLSPCPHLVYKYNVSVKQGSVTAPVTTCAQTGMEKYSFTTYQSFSAKFSKPLKFNHRI